jgi:hypothetical protein
MYRYLGINVTFVVTIFDLQSIFDLKESKDLFIIDSK